MTAFMDFCISSDEFLVGEALDADAADHVELAQFVPVGTVLVPYLWVAADDYDAVRSELVASPHVATAAELDGATGRGLFRVTWNDFDDPLLDNLRRHDLLVQRAIGADGRWKFRLVAEGRETFAAFQSACQEDGPQLTVTRLSDSVARDCSLYGLTEKQRDALLRAYEAGYYDSNVHVSLGEISGDLDISQQALGARLKRGVDALIRNTIAVEESV